MLRELMEYAERKNLALPPGFAAKEARWAVVFSEQGQYGGVVELGNPAEKRNRGRRFPMAPDLSQPELIAGGDTRSHFLIETAAVVALLDVEDTDAKTRAKHRFFLHLLDQAGAVMPSLKAAATALADPQVLAQVRHELETQKARAADKLTLLIGNEFPVESDVWHEWWLRFRRSLPTKRATSEWRRCLVTGELIQPARTHAKIRGVTGGLATGTVLVGCDKEAFASYGFQHAENAAMSDKTANAYVEALNDLLRHHSRSLGNVQVVYWFKKTVPPEEDPVAFLMEPTSISEREAQHRAAEFLDALRVGKLTDLAGNHYYALTISGSGGRVMVRDWMEGQFEQLGKNVAAWFDDLTIVQSDGRQLARLVRFREVLAATARQLDDVPANRAACLWRVALGNLPITTEVLSQALMHNTLDVINNRQPNYARLGLLKAYHIRKMRKEGGVSMSNNVEPMLNENHPAPAYHCGRLLAVLAELQHSALGEVGAGVVQRYYAAASSTPGLVLGRLVRTSQFHLDKLDRGLARWYENQLAAIWGRLGDQVPRTLNLEEQSLFALGYYQQLAHMRSRGRGATSPTLQPASASPEAQSEEK